MRKSKNESATHATVYLRITYDGKRAEASTMRKVPLAKWNTKHNLLAWKQWRAKFERYYRFLKQKEEHVLLYILK